MSNNLFTPDISDGLISKLDSSPSISLKHLGRLYYTSSQNDIISEKVSKILSSRLKEDSSFKDLGEFLGEFKNDIDTLKKASFLDPYINRFFPSLFFNIAKGLFGEIYEYHSFSPSFRVELFEKVSNENRLTISTNIRGENFFYRSLEFIYFILKSIEKKRVYETDLLPPIYGYAANHENWKNEIDYRVSTVLLLMNAIREHFPVSNINDTLPQLALSPELLQQLIKINNNSTMTSLMLKIIYVKNVYFENGSIHKVFSLLLEDEITHTTNWDAWINFFEQYPQHSGNDFWSALGEYLKQKDSGSYYYHYFEIRDKLKDIISQYPEFFL